MKNRILTFIIGFITGAIIVTTGFFIYIKVINNNQNRYEMMQMNENGQMQPPNGNMEEPPVKPYSRDYEKQ